MYEIVMFVTISDYSSRQQVGAVWMWNFKMGGGGQHPMILIISHSPARDLWATAASELLTQAHTRGQSPSEIISC